MIGVGDLAIVGLTGSTVGTALSLPLVLTRQIRPVETRLMGGWLLGLSAVAALISARAAGILPPWTQVDHAVNLFGFVTYPLLFLYIRQTRGSDRRARPWWLWIPAAVYCGSIATASALGVGTRVPFTWILPALLAFTGVCLWQLRERPDAARSGPVPAAWVVGFLIVLNAAQVVRLVFGHVAPVRAIVPVTVTAGFVALVGFVAWRFVEGFARGPRYEKSRLDESAGRALLARIDAGLSANRLFADPELTLGRLAAAVNGTPHQVSEVLNRFAGVTFHELLNQRRVADVKAQLLEPSSARYTIEGIGAAAGFGSRSALYAAFRRLEGMTPAQFRALRASAAPPAPPDAGGARRADRGAASPAPSARR